MNDLERIFRDNNDRIIFKWDHYFDIYEKHFDRFRGNEVVILEIGVSQGGSLQMWKKYFGAKAKIYGIDIDPRCKAFEEDGISVFIGSQSDRNFLKRIRNEIPPIDILIDDGGHTMRQQIVTFEELFSHVKDNGVYLCEDCHSSYRWEFGGGVKRWGTFIEYTKKWIDYINAFHSKSSRLKVNEFTLNVKSLHYYDSIVVVEKGKRTEPTVSKSGTLGFTENPIKQSLFLRLCNRARLIYRRVSALLRLPYRLD